MRRLRRGVGRECDAERIQRFVVAPHPHPAPRAFQHGDADEPDRDPRPRPDHEEVQRGPSPPPSRRAALGQQRHRGEHDRQQDQVVEPALERQHLAGGDRDVSAPQQAAHHHGVGRGEGGAEDRRGAGREAEQRPRRDRDERRRDQRAGAEHQADQGAVAPDLSDVDGHGVAEQHQHESEDRDRLEDRRVQPEVHQPEPERPDGQAEQQEERDLGEARALDEPREQGGDDDDDADEGQRGGERIGHR